VSARKTQNQEIKSRRRKKDSEGLKLTNAKKKKIGGFTDAANVVENIAKVRKENQPGHIKRA